MLFKVVKLAIFLGTFCMTRGEFLRTIRAFPDKSNTESDIVFRHVNKCGVIPFVMSF